MYILLHIYDFLFAWLWCQKLHLWECCHYCWIICCAIVCIVKFHTIFCIFSIISYNFFGCCQSKCTTSMKSRIMCLHDMFKVQHGLITTLYVDLLSCCIDVWLYLVKLKWKVPSQTCSNLNEDITNFYV